MQITSFWVTAGQDDMRACELAAWISQLLHPLPLIGIAQARVLSAALVRTGNDLGRHLLERQDDHG